VGWAEIGPKGVRPISAQQFSLFFSLGLTKPRHQGWARSGLAQKVKKKKNGRGIISPLRPTASRTCSACRRNLS